MKEARSSVLSEAKRCEDLSANSPTLVVELFAKSMDFKQRAQLLFSPSRGKPRQNLPNFVILLLN
jgi:hypothetical protein